MADKEEIKTLEELEEKGRILRGYKEKFRQIDVYKRQNVQRIRRFIMW